MERHFVTLQNPVTSSVIGVQEEAEPVTHAIVGRELTSGGASEAGRGAKRPEAPIGLLTEQRRCD